LAALEAMAAGVPVISSNTGGIPEVNVQGVSGYLSDVGDIEDMSKNTLHILEDSTLATFKINAKNQSEKFSLELVLPKYEEIYSKLVNKG
jgi:glycosyltransferase involved in cell wall biosynthesis